jgi:hypothetical protein
MAGSLNADFFPECLACRVASNRRQVRVCDIFCSEKEKDRMENHINQSVVPAQAGTHADVELWPSTTTMITLSMGSRLRVVATNGEQRRSGYLTQP